MRAAAIATSSVATGLAKGKSIEEALKITRKTVADELGGLPPQKLHCSNLASDALRMAITDYFRKTDQMDRIKGFGLEKELKALEIREKGEQGEVCED